MNPFRAGPSPGEGARLPTGRGECFQGCCCRFLPLPGPGEGGGEGPSLPEPPDQALQFAGQPGDARSFAALDLACPTTVCSATSEMLITFRLISSATRPVPGRGIGDWVFIAEI